MKVNGGWFGARAPEVPDRSAKSLDAKVLNSLMIDALRFAAEPVPKTAEEALQRGGALRESGRRKAAIKMPGMN